VKLPKLYEKRDYLKDPETGKRLKTTVMYDDDLRVESYNNVLERLRIRILNKAKELGGKNLQTRDFIDAFRTRGPNYGDVIRTVMRELENQGRIRMRDVGKGKRKQYRYDVVETL
jgi:hypothetical protein